MLQLHKLNNENNFYKFGEDYDLGNKIIFVFGSNTAGIHGRGAALTARKTYNARLGTGLGFTGQCYAIPTKDKNLDILPLNIIQKYIRDFKNITNIDNNDTFYITPIGTGLAGYKHEQIAPMFKGVNNCWLPDIWKPFL